MVVDTSGWVSGPEAVALKLAKGGILGAAHIVLVERERELQAFRRAWRGLPEFPLHVLAPVAAVVRRPMDERRTFRETAFRRALEGAVECELDLGEIAISGARELEGPLPALPPGVLLGLNDGRGSLLSVGILLQMAPDSGKMTCLCRPEGARAAEVRIGRLLLNPDGTHSPLLA
jgi:polynucleotide 5'-kinase involved in rRNA processing